MNKTTNIKQLLALAKDITPKDVKEYINARHAVTTFKEHQPYSKEWYEWKVLEAVAALSEVNK